MRRPLILLAVLASVASVLAGCAGVPTSGPIEQGPSIAAPGNDQFIRVIARPPVDGMTPEEVVRGFQEATASQDTGFGVAKQYLTAVAATTWNPAKGVTIYDTSGLTFESAGSTVSAVGRQSGEIDRSGQYTVAAPGTQLSVEYRLQRIDGQWRISALPDGLVLGRGDIDRGYRAFNLYYFTRDSSILVPAPVMLPLSNAGVATRLVSALLAGPTPWIAPSVRTGFPEGTTLVPEAVPVVDGVADVALSDAVLTADDRARQSLSAQLVWTLRQLPDISGVRISVNGRPLLVPGVGSTQSMTDWVTYDPDAVPDTFTAYALSGDGRLLKVDADAPVAPVLTPEPSGVLPAVSLEATDV
ncbi:MAG: GerMN domain-containing protein, partial [Candidatus Nanopelagicales bacterium]